MAETEMCTMTNAERILRVLDAQLDHEVELTLFGRAALVLGYPHPPQGIENTRDVDAIIPASQSAEIESDHQFWTALEHTNREIEGEGLYLTHLFDENQIIHAPGWLGRRVRITLPDFHRLRLFRPATQDLILTKMMRGLDESDWQDITFLIGQDDFEHLAFSDALEGAIFPESEEIRTLFDAARQRLHDTFGY